MAEYHDPLVETAKPEKIQKIQLQRIRRTLEVSRGSPLYREKLFSRGTGAKVETLGDIPGLPLTTKEDLRKAYPFGTVAVSLRDVVYFRRTSGTSGKPAAIYFTKGDLDHSLASGARNYFMAGIRKGDRVQLAIYPQLAVVVQGGLSEVGAMSIVTGTGNDLGQLSLIEDLEVTTIFGVPSYLLHLGEAKKRGQGSTVKRIVTLGEPVNPSNRAKIENAWGAELFDNYGSAEMAQGNYECEEHDGHHALWDDFLMETIDPRTEEVTEGSGELVFTTLSREATPLIRYRTGDVVELVKDECSCGRTTPRIFLKRRLGEMVKVRGTSLYPSAIREVLHGIQGVTNFQVVLGREASLDVLTVRVESKESSDELSELIKDQVKALTNLRPRIEFVPPGSLLGETKTRELVDLRDRQ
jgi:phenylacetate-CoA ligase